MAGKPNKLIQERNRKIVDDLTEMLKKHPDRSVIAIATEYADKHSALGLSPFTIRDIFKNFVG